MTILFLARRFYPQVGGVEKHVLEISKRLVEKGHKVIVITEHEDKLKLKEIVDGIEVRRIKVGKDGWLKKFRIWGALWDMRKVVRRADVIHCHDVFFWYLPFRFLYPGKRV